jgi:hypothetical protein
MANESVSQFDSFNAAKGPSLGGADRNVVGRLCRESNVSFSLQAVARVCGHSAEGIPVSVLARRSFSTSKNWILFIFICL